MFLAPAEAVIMQALADAMTPPPPPDVWEWACTHLEFDKGPFKGAFDPSRFPMLERILDCLSPEHPSREVTVMGSAQIGKTESIIKPALGCWFDQAPQDALVVHPTSTAAAEWMRTKWLPFRRSNPRMKLVFGSSAGQLDSMSYQETIDRTTSLRVVSAGSPSELSGTTRPYVVLDDLSKFESSDMGDPEQLAISRADAYEDDAKIGRFSTAMIAGACRINRAYKRGTAERWNVPCPHCETEQPLAWENFVAVAEDPHQSHFECVACRKRIEFRHRDEIVAAGRWIAENPAGDHPSFHLWRAIMPFRNWASIAIAWAQAQGDASTEQTFFNDTLGLPYDQASDAPDWTLLRNRAENAEHVPARTRVPAARPILTCGVDCQGDRMEYQIVAFGRENRAHTVDYDVIPHHIGDDEGRAALDALLKRRWRNASGRDLPLDRLVIDGGTYTDDVWDWAKRHPWDRVNISKGASSGNGPIYQLQRFDRRKDGKVKRRQKRAYLVNVSALKASLYADLKKEDPDARGHQSFPAGLGDAFFRMLCAERRVLKRNRFGVVESRWEIVESDGRNEALDTRIMADVAAHLEGSRTLTEEDWDALEATRDAPPADAEPDLFDKPIVDARPTRSTSQQDVPKSSLSVEEDIRAQFNRLRRS